jgi:hypothetical protein
MNERIKELARQACITIVPEPFDDASRAWNNTMEKFAELIVAECAEACEKNSYLALNGWQRAKQIREHFGVEE